MSDTESTTPETSDTEAEESAPAPEETTEPQPDPEPVDETDWRSKYEAQQKVNRDLEKKLKGEAGNLQKELSSAKAEAQEHAARALRYEVAVEKGVPLDLADRLTGTTREELTADADVLRKHVNGSASSAFAPGVRAEPPVKHDPNDLIRAALRTT